MTAMTTADAAEAFLRSAPQQRRCLVQALMRVLVDLRRWDQYRRYSPNVRDHLVPPDVPPDELERELVALQQRLRRLAI
jgi:hypothetical protein